MRTSRRRSTKPAPRFRDSERPKGGTRGSLGSPLNFQSICMTRDTMFLSIPLAALLLAAAGWDLARRRVPNAFPIAAHSVKVSWAANQSASLIVSASPRLVHTASQSFPQSCGL